MSEDWRAQAACRGMDPESFQPETATQAEVAQAKAVCQHCPLVAFTACRELARSQDGAYGVHAGEWYGAPPKGPGVVECGWCGVTVRGGVRRKFCSHVCTKRASLSRQTLSA